jgi:hypothetical protein
MTIFWLACLAILALPGSAAAAIEVESFSFGSSSAQAGAHPDVIVDVSFAEPGEPETAQDAVVQLPRGLFLYPWTLPRCVTGQLAADNCPIGSQVGVVHVHANLDGDPNSALETAPVYLVIPNADELIRLAFQPLGFAAPVEVPVRARAADGYSLSLAFEELPEAMPISSLELALWGVPPASSHDDERGPAPPVPGGRPSGIPETPFTRHPTACGTTTATLTAHSYEDPDSFVTALASGPAISGCHILPFGPVAIVTLSSKEAASATGVGMEYHLPQNLAPNGLATSDTEAIALYLPPGLAVNEVAASQQAACTLAQANLATDDPAACPPASKIGTFGGSLAGTSDLLEGSVYFGGLEGPGEYLLFLVAIGAGIELKLPAWLGLGSEAELVIPELPQLPLEELDLQTDPAASLFTTPPRCGTFEVGTEAIDWSQPDVASILPSSFTIDSGPGGGTCPEPQAGQNPPPTSTPPAATLPATPKPTVKLLEHPPHRGRDRTPTFRFASSVAGSTFQCKLDHRSWRLCRSPLTLRKLGLGNHALRIKASAAGEASAIVTYRFILAQA